MSKQKLDILEVIYAFETGGSERLAASIAKAAQDKKRRVAVCSIHGDSGPIRKQLEADNILCLGINSRMSPKIVKQIKFFLILKKMSPTVVHYHHVTQMIFGYWPARLAGVKRQVMTEHANYSIKKYGRLRNLARKYAIKMDTVTTVYNGLTDYFHDEIGVDKKQLKTIPNGINLDKFSLIRGDTEEPKIFGEKKEFVIVCVGRLVEAKDHRNLVMAAKLMAEKSSEAFHIYIVGGGKLESDIADYINSQGLQNRVTMMGERTDIENILSEADLCVISSKREGLPMVLLESLVSGTPCISTAVGGIPDILSGFEEFMVEPENPEALANAISGTLAEYDRYQSMTLELKKIVRERYSIEKVLQQYMEVLDV